MDFVLVVAIIIVALVVIVWLVLRELKNDKKLSVRDLAVENEEMELKKRAFLASHDLSNFKEIDRMAEVVVRCLGQPVDEQPSNFDSESSSELFEFSNDSISILCEWRTLKRVLWNPDGNESKIVYDGDGDIKDTDDDSWLEYLKAIYYSVKDLNERYEHIDAISSRIVEEIDVISKSPLFKSYGYHDERINIRTDRISDNIVKAEVSVPMGDRALKDVFSWAKHSSVKAECGLYIAGSWEDYLHQLYDKVVRFNAMSRLDRATYVAEKEAEAALEKFEKNIQLPDAVEQ